MFTQFFYFNFKSKTTAPLSLFKYFKKYFERVAMNNSYDLFLALQTTVPQNFKQKKAETKRKSAQFWKEKTQQKEIFSC